MVNGLVLSPPPVGLVVRHFLTGLLTSQDRGFCPPSQQSNFSSYCAAEKGSFFHQKFHAYTSDVMIGGPYYDWRTILFKSDHEN